MADSFVHLNVSNGGQLPKGVKGLPDADSKNTNARYESTVMVSGPFSGTFRCTLYPDDMTVKGRLQDGMYPIFLGFHHPKTPHKSDLVPRTNGFRAVIVVNANLPVPVTSQNPDKTYATDIHFHNGWYHWKSGTPMSEGCALLHPADWERFIKLFLKHYPDVSQWSINGGRLGQMIGFLFVNTSGT